MQEPLASRIRPTNIDEMIGQKHLVGPGKIIRKCIEADRIFSMIFFGPPGTGKTTLATIIANQLNLKYRFFSAVSGNKKDLDQIFFEAKMSQGMIVIIDEIHRLNKDKQDLLLPHVENGTITIIGTTTSNPYHSVNPAIRSRTQLFEFKPLTYDDLLEAMLHALKHPKGLNNQYQCDMDALKLIAKQGNGDIRYTLNILEICAISSDGNITKEVIEQFTTIPNLAYDHDEDGYYDVLSGFQKSIRGSDVDAALYYLGVMIQANDLSSIERRLITTAYEDIGLANPSACARCVQAVDAAKRIGFPEGRIPLAVAVIDLCLSPKSKSGEAGIDAAMSVLNKAPARVPEYLRLTPVNMSEDAKYDYSRSDLWPMIQYLPKEYKDLHFYEPNYTSSYEKVLASNLQKLRSVKRWDNLVALKKAYPKK